MTQTNSADWLRKNVHKVKTPAFSHTEYFDALTALYFKATDDHFLSELCAEIHVDWAIDGFTEMSATEFRLFKSAYNKVKKYLANHRKQQATEVVAA